MKKLFIAIVASTITTATIQAQEKVEQPAQKMDKKAEKAKKEAQLQEIFAAAGLSEAEKEACKKILEESSEKSKAVKKDIALSEDERKSKLDDINKEKNEKLKAAMSDEKFKLYNKAKRAQKEAETKSTAVQQ